ncbi:MAG: hypothetical protein EOP58_10950 [Sphingomonadales bacterium]|nr:MAG: hypothetical protein EOP58_10950 [Sphingomonadales bacterium]
MRNRAGLSPRDFSREVERLDLLLLLTALLASLTGAGSGDRQLRQVQGVAVVQAAEAARAAVQPARRAAPFVAPHSTKIVQAAAPAAATATSVSGTHFPFERRLE